MSYVQTRSRATLRGLGATLSPKFVEQVTLGQGALSQLATVATTIQRLSTDPGIAEAGRIGKVFAETTGPRLLNEALVAGDVAKVARVQGATTRILAALKPEVIPAVLDRWKLLVLVGPAGAFVSADTVDAAKEGGRQAIEDALPDFLKNKGAADDVAFAIKAALGLAALGTAAYVVRTFR